jgi:trk system potassium uptake protein TrkH
MSGLTTTGSTVFVGLDRMSPALLLWRSMLQWIGGLGFTLMAIAILPLVGVGGMRLFRSESSDWSDKALPHARDIAKTIALIYLGLSTLCTLAYWAAGMSLFDAINHAMATVSTGGFSTSDSSMGKFASPTILWISVIFMISGSLPFMGYYHALREGPMVLVRDEQIRTFGWILLAAIVPGAVILAATTDYGMADALTAVAFNAASVVTTTGFASTDYLLWGPFFVGFFYFLMFIGGCSGSTAGSVKVFRLQIAFKFLSVQVRKLVHPKGVFRAKLNGRRLDDDILSAFVAFAFAIGLTIVTVTMALAAMGIDLVTALSAATTAVTNVGPGIGPIVGPAGNFSTLPEMAKWLLAIAMLMGRLELMTVLVLFSRSYWRA